MIPKLQEKPFSSKVTLSQKIDYSIKKMQKGECSLLYDSSFLNDTNALYDEMVRVGDMSERTVNKFNEVSINLAPGEKISDSKFIEIANEYMKRLGYENSCYNIWRHTDKAHEHVHILFTTVDYQGGWISDSLSKIRSAEIARDLEVEFGLKRVEKGEFKSENLNSIKAREYYFDNALKKGLWGYNTKSELGKLILPEDLQIIVNHKMRNEELEILLGKELYEKVGAVLESHSLFKKQYKAELLSKLDSIYKESITKEEFFSKIEQAGLYVRMVSDRGNHAYVYGLPDVAIYFKDKQLPLTYRYDNISKFIKGPSNVLLESEQKNRIYNKAFIALENAENFGDYKLELKKLGVILSEYKNASGVYGLMMKLDAINEAVNFKSSSISRKLTYNNLQDYFNGKETSIGFLMVQHPTLIKELKEDENRYDGIIPNLQDFGNDDAEAFLRKKKRKKKSRDNSYDI